MDARRRSLHSPMLRFSALALMGAVGLFATPTRLPPIVRSVDEQEKVDRLMAEMGLAMSGAGLETTKGEA